MTEYIFNFLTYVFYIVVCAYSLGVFWKKPHPNWEISRKIIKQLAYMGLNDVNKNKELCQKLMFIQRRCSTVRPVWLRIKKSSKFAFLNVANVAKQNLTAYADAKILYFVTEQRLYNWFCLSNVKLDDFT